jgi:hypothetical protein
MAFLQTELPPSTAPAGAVAVALPAPRRIIRRAKPASPFRRRLAIGFGIGLLMLVPGYVAAQETESLVMGILAGDLAFLVAVAGWSAVVSGARR